MPEPLVQKLLPVELRPSSPWNLTAHPLPARRIKQGQPYPTWWLHGREGHWHSISDTASMASSGTRSVAKGPGLQEGCPGGTPTARPLMWVATVVLQKFKTSVTRPLQSSYSQFPKVL